MSGEPLSLILWCRQDAQTDVIHARVTSVDTGETMHVDENTFLLRITTDQTVGVERCSIRHVASGRVAHVQGGPNLRTFINDCVLRHNEPEQSGTPEKPEM